MTKYDIDNKKCNQCQKIKLAKFFSIRKASKDGLQSCCKDCCKLRSKKFYRDNKEYYQKRYTDNQEKILNHNKHWNNQNKEKIDKHKQKFKENNPFYYREYLKLNKEKINMQTRARSAYRRKTDPLYKLKNNYRNRLYDFYRGVNRSKKSEEILGLSWVEFKQYLESKFIEGMTWENYGKWHIDHIIPLASAKNAKELEKLFYYTNCQPLWAKENLRKGDKIFSDA